MGKGLAEEHRVVCADGMPHFLLVGWRPIQ
jgi:hypothetical protein